MKDAERIARLELEVERLSRVVEGLRSAAGKEAIPKGDCHKGFDPSTCPNAGPYMYQRGCRGKNEDGTAGCSPANAAYYKEHPRNGKATKVAAPVRKVSAPAEPVRKKRVIGRG